MHGGRSDQIEEIEQADPGDARDEMGPAEKNLFVGRALRKTEMRLLENPDQGRGVEQFHKFSDEDEAVIAFVTLFLVGEEVNWKGVVKGGVQFAEKRETAFVGGTH